MCEVSHVQEGEEALRTMVHAKYARYLCLPGCSSYLESFLVLERSPQHLILHLQGMSIAITARQHVQSRSRLLAGMRNRKGEAKAMGGSDEM